MIRTSLPVGARITTQATSHFRSSLMGTVVSIESHDAAPWTRYGVRFDDGSSMDGAVVGLDINAA